ncbi:hypothetical protein PTQ19_10275 [Microbacterium esteraromaticum]|uniref:hypothetical protein n=1 Tax=Microbacterium esteraromaticum TaxID=57043 RepID=UPI002368F159|nr:hypothetical protein [Microbacterium esteraromaticum]WDH77907.1 hypothetical protein PTQ19_10275 [Microbacterium esteraromaticum]
MICAAAAFPVSFGPHEADWWMVAVTASSVVVSSVLAWLAYRNGRRATVIASEAAARDEERGVQASIQRAEEARAEVALSMLRALAVMERFASNEPHYADLETELHLRRAEALAQIDVYSTSEADEELHVWFAAQMAELEKLGRRTPVTLAKVIPIVGFVRQGIVLWNQRAVSVDSLVMGQLE